MEWNNTREEQPEKDKEVLGKTDTGELCICVYDPKYGIDWWIKAPREIDFGEEPEFFTQDIEDFGMSIEQWMEIGELI